MIDYFDRCADIRTSSLTFTKLWDRCPHDAHSAPTLFPNWHSFPSEFSPGRVSSDVGNVRNNRPELVEPVMIEVMDIDSLKINVAQ